MANGSQLFLIFIFHSGGLFVLARPMGNQSPNSPTSPPISPITLPQNIFRSILFVVCVFKFNVHGPDRRVGTPLAGFICFGQNQTSHMDFLLTCTHHNCPQLH